LLTLHDEGTTHASLCRVSFVDSFADGVQLLPQAARGSRPVRPPPRHRDHSAPMLPVTGNTMPVM
jgi:hypothetical protein